MPYNTRRKSLSLPALGIQLPQTSRAHRTSLSRPNKEADSQHEHPSKRVKRSHNSRPSSPGSPTAITTPPSAVSTTKSVTFADRPKSRHAHEQTPPPSPGASDGTKVDTEGINDDIVIGVIEQLEMTGNRPHLIKELATVLSTTNLSVSNSANPAALLSSRLASYMRRSWTALSPCPIAKELIPVHPRKVFYYLTTTRRQELPTSPIEGMSVMGPPLHAGSKRIISPSLSNGSQEDDDASMAEDRKRAALSPSPEIDLSMDLGDSAQVQQHFPTPGSSLTGCPSGLGDSCSDVERDYSHHRRTESPPLEGDEREFSDTARDIFMREHEVAEASADVAQRLAAAKLDATTVPSEMPESEEDHVKRNSEAVAALFGAHTSPSENEGVMILSSPMIKPSQGPATTIKMEVGVENASIDTLVQDDSILGEASVSYGMGINWEIERPESIDVDELDDWFDGF